MSTQDRVAPDASLLRFDFAEHAVRGAVIRIAQPWADWIRGSAHPVGLQQVLGQATAALPLMAAQLKFRGKMNLQFQHGAGLDLLVVQIDHTLKLRSTLKRSADASAEHWATASAGGQLAVLIEPESADERYQAVVAAGGASLADDLEQYFRQSEQLTTHLWLAADDSACAGVLIQQMPGTDGAQDASGLETINALAQTLTERELLDLSPQTLVHRLFATEGVRLFDERPVTLQCNCGRDRVSALLLSMGQAEVDSVLAQEGQVEVTCEFCERAEQFSADDCAALFQVAAEPPQSDTVH